MELMPFWLSTADLFNEFIIFPLPAQTWLQEWRQRLQDSPDDLKLINDLITEILSCDQHPLSQLLKRYQIAIYHKIMPLIQKKLPSIEEIVVPYRDVEPLKLQGNDIV